ncbi:hypothetical protein BGX21_005078 [Mortierella sp. AD011]|nr:hypothetical protein BGX21_005078 [Mortierella sp. AD011]
MSPANTHNTRSTTRGKRAETNNPVSNVDHNVSVNNEVNESVDGDTGVESDIDLNNDRDVDGDSNVDVNVDMNIENVESDDIDESATNLGSDDMNSQFILDDDMSMDPDNLVLNESTMPTRSDKELLAELNVEKKRLTLRKIAAARLLAAPVPAAQREKNLRTYDASLVELNDVNERIKFLEESLKELAALERPARSKKEKSSKCEGSGWRTEALKTTSDMPRFHKNSNPLEFLDRLQHEGNALVGREKFAQVCDRYLLLMTKSDYHCGLLDIELKKPENKNPTWEQCETIFLHIALNAQELQSHLLRSVQTGRLEEETYKQYAMRVSRDIRIFGTEDNNSAVLSVLEETVDPLVRTIMRFGLQAKKRKETFDSINEFIELLASVDGPQDTRSLLFDSSDKLPSETSLCTKNAKNHTKNNGAGPMRHRQNKIRFSPQNGKARSYVTRNDDQDKRFFCEKCGKNSTHTSNDCI